MESIVSEQDDNIKKNNNKFKKILITVIILTLIIIITGILFVLKRKEEIAKKEQELEQKLNSCYTAIAEHRDFNEYMQILSSITDESDKSKAYEKLGTALDVLIENLSANYTFGNKFDLLDFFDSMKESKTTDSNVQEVIEQKRHCMSYVAYLKTAEENKNKGNLWGVKVAYNSALREIRGVDEEKTTIVLNLINEIDEKANQYLKDELSKKIEEKNYSQTYGGEEDLIKSSGDSELIKIFEQYKNEKENAEKEAMKAKKKSEGVRIGMTKQQVLDSMWGEPKKINRTITEYGVSEQWVYENENYLYFENNILTGIQN